MTGAVEAPGRGATDADAALRPRRPWVHGGSSTRGWDTVTLGWCVAGLGLGLLAGGVVSLVVGAPGGLDAGTVTLWAVLAMTTALVFRRGVPRGLFAFRWLDLLYGVVLGVLLRLVQGFVAVATGAPPGLPATASFEGGPPSSYWLLQALTAGLAAPVVEEVFFRGALLVGIFVVVRRLAGGGTVGARLAGAVAVVGATALFVLAHALTSPLTVDAVVSLALVGLVAGALVVLTRRIWAAVVLHVVFNGMLVALLYVGTTFA